MSLRMNELLFLLLGSQIWTTTPSVRWECTQGFLHASQTNFCELNCAPSPGILLLGLIHGCSRSPHDPITPQSPCLWTLQHWGVDPQYIASGRHLKLNHNESRFFHHFLEFLHASFWFSGHLQDMFPGPLPSWSAISLSQGQLLLVFFFK